MTTPATPITPPRNAVALRRGLDAGGWTIQADQSAVGLDTAFELGPPRGDGTRPKLEILVEVESHLLRACHPDGRAFAAVWERRTEPARSGWRLVMAFRGRRPDEWAPAALTATQLRTYIAGPQGEES